VEPAQQEDVVGAPVPAPVTERVLQRLGRPRVGWILAWSFVALVSPLVFSAAIRLSGRPFEAVDFAELLTTQGVLAYVVFVLLSGTGVLARQASGVVAEVAGLLPKPVSPPLFTRLGSVAGPVVLTLVAVAVVSAGGYVAYGPLPPLAALPLLSIYLLPILTFAWVYVAILADLDRIGQHTLRLDVIPYDRTLGLGKVGSLASTGLGLLLAAAIPLLLVAVDEPVTLAIAIVIVAATVAAFLWSMWRIHRQMGAAKARYVEVSERLYRDAYAPLREKPDVAILEAQATVLTAAEALDQRAHGLPTWPIDESTGRFIAVIVTGVVTSLVVRVFFAAIGAG
jgi:hypothetical protein